jgi:creatinine amidohydrolase
MIYGNLTSPQLGSLAPELIAVLPLAAVEQHGDHLPLATDTSIADRLSEIVEESLREQVVLLPTLWCGSSHHHKGFPGTLSLRSETYIEVLIDLIMSLVDSGFRRIFLLNCHGGNQTPFTEALYRLNLKLKGADEPWIAAASYWHLASEELSRQTFMQTPKLSHACEYETSMMLALNPNHVHGAGSGSEANIHSAFYDPLNYHPSRVVVLQSFEQMSANGALGSPDHATAEKGELLFPLIASAIIKFLQEFSSWPLPRNSGKPLL